MATKLKEVDVVIVGLGWTGGILAKELAEAGLKVVALERGALRIAARTTIRHAQHPRRAALRRAPRPDAEHRARHAHGPQQPLAGGAADAPARLVPAGRGVGGAGVHWSGHTWRWTDMEFKVRSMYEERYGKNFIPDDMTIQDWGITYAELEPYYDQFEYTAAVSGKAGNIKGKIQAGGNPFEAPRAREYPLPPLTPILASEMFAEARARAGYHPFPRPSANASQRLHQPRRRAVRRLPVLRLLPALRLRGQRQGQPAHHRDPDRDAQSEFRAAHAFLGHEGAQGFRRQAGHRRHLHQRAQRRGIRAAGRHRAAVRLCHQQRAPDAAVGHRPAVRPGRADRRGRQELLLPDRRRCDAVLRGQVLQSVHGAGGSNATIDDFNVNWASTAARTASSAATTSPAASTPALPIGYRPVPRGTPQWGNGWKQATAKWYQTAMNIGASGSVMANRYNYFDLDPTYRNAFGQPLMRMTFDYKDNEHKMGTHAAEVINDIAKSMNPTHLNAARRAPSRGRWCRIRARTTPAAPSWAPIRTAP